MGYTLARPGHSVARVKILGRSDPRARNMVFQKVTGLFPSNSGGNAGDNLVFRF